MTNKELVLSMLAELSTTEISQAVHPEKFSDHQKVARQGGEVAWKARIDLESKTGRKVVSPLNAKSGIFLKKSPSSKRTKE